jgi:hypothetical protein
MTYQDDPNLNRGNRRAAADDTNYSGWIIGGIVGLALVIGLFAMFGRDKTNVASDTPNRPAATAPSTTGSGSASSAIPNDPNGTAPQRDTNQPAPAPGPATPAPAPSAR